MSLKNQYFQLKPDQYLDVSYIDDEGNGAEVIYNPQPPLAPIDIHLQGANINIDNLVSNNIENYIRAIELIWGYNSLNDPGIIMITQYVKDAINKYLLQGYERQPKRNSIIIPDLIKNLISTNERVRGKEKLLRIKDELLRQEKFGIPISLIDAYNYYVNDQGIYIDVSNIDDRGNGFKTITDIEPPLFGSPNINLVSDNIENYIKAIQIIWGDPALEDNIIKESIELVYDLINEYQIDSGYISKQPSMTHKVQFEENKLSENLSEKLLDINYIETLPHDAIIKIALDLNLNQITNLCKLNTNFNRAVCNNNEFWRRKYLLDFNEIPILKNTELSTSKLKSQNWKELYKNVFRKIEILKFIISNFREYEFERLNDRRPFGAPGTYEEFINNQLNYLLNISDRKLYFLEESIDLIKNNEFSTMTIDKESAYEKIASGFLINKYGRTIYLNKR